MQRNRPATRRVNIRPDDIEITTSPWLDRGFTITLIEWRAGQEIRYNIHLDFFWLGILAEKLHEVIKKAQGVLDTALMNMRG